MWRENCQLSKDASNWNLAYPSHPDFDTGVLEWRMSSVWSSIGVPPSPTETPVSKQPNGSIMMESGGSIHFNQTRESKAGFIFCDSTVTLRLDMDARTVSWMREGHPATLVTRPLPDAEGAYTPW
eukprot:gnl/Dysnectes_brevis/8166_a14340_237.p1 GENE.gnl/Dysnectes_brevis/8166_a14340_237~~gnl/Dysnectes_brevis/8166_a14340_237.p1  ORF type:complete len:125 (+),score=15.05 gnl/Dysnectes_brevis/8166_a14340_237:247-621(+)